jgi:hypothetical protein
MPSVNFSYNHVEASEVSYKTFEATSIQYSATGYPAPYWCY